MQNPHPSLTQTQVQTRVNSFVRGVYNWMAIGLALTGVVAYLVVNNQALATFVRQSFFLLAIAEIGLVIALSGFINKIKASTATGIFLIYAILNGATISILLKMYTGSTVATAFFVCAASFLALSLYGWTTKKDLTGLGSFMFMGLIGIVIASVVNIFMRSPAMLMIISYIGVLVFAGLTAYDTQQIKMMALSQPDHTGAAAVRKGSIIGALKLYLDFILMFQYLLIIFGGNRR